jgi:NitT/TauT family transport system permease protein
VNRLIRYAPLLILALAWEAAARTNLVSGLDLPPVSDIVVTWVELLRDGDLLPAAWASLSRGAAGLALAIGIGSVLGFAMAWWRPVGVVVGPLVEMFYPLPKSALIPVTIIWLGYGPGSKILLILLGCMLPVTVAAYNGARGTDPFLIWSARAMGAGSIRVLWDVVLPAASGELLNGIRTALALAFILLVASELIVARDGLGYLIGYLGNNGSYEGMFALVLTVASTGFLADRLYQLLSRRLSRWHD